MYLKYAFFLLLFTIFTLSGCGGGKQSSEATPRAIIVSGTTTSAIIGEDIILFALLQYSDASSESITEKATWSSKDTTIASVSDQAKVVCRSAGETSIIATYQNFSFNYDITCETAPYIAEIEFTPLVAEVNEGEKLPITARAILSNGDIAKNMTFTWRIPEETADKATIDAKTGLLTGLRYGETSVKVSVNNPNTPVKLASTQSWPTIKIKPVTSKISLALDNYDPKNPPLDDIALNLDLGEKGRIVVLEHKTDGSISDISQKINKWSYLRSEIALVEKGQISTRNIGSTEINISGYNGFQAINVVIVNVEQPLALYVTQESPSAVLLEWKPKFSSTNYRILRQQISTGIIDEPIEIEGLSYLLTTGINGDYQYSIAYKKQDGTYSDDNIDPTARKWVTVQAPLNNGWAVKNSLPDRAHSARVIFQDKIYVFGGEITDSAGTTLVSDEIWQYSMRTHHWSFEGSMPAPLRDSAACLSGDNVFLFGGSDGANPTAMIYAYNLTTGTWAQPSTLPPLPYALEAASCSMVNEFAYLTGGFNGDNISNEVHRFNTENLTISTLTKQLLSPRYNHASVTFEEQIFIAGGTSENDSAISTIEVFNSVDNSIRNIAQMPTARQHFAMEIIDNNIYVLGGVGNQGNILNSVEFFTPNETPINWKTSNPLPFPNAAFITAYSATNKLLYLFGGSETASDHDSNVANQMIYSPNELTWYPLLKPKENIYASSFGYIGEKIYLIGGRDINNINLTANKGKASNQTQEYDVRKNAWISDTVGPGPLNTARAEAATVSIGDRVFIFGGIGSNEEYLTSIEVLGDSSSPNNWLPLSIQLRQPRAEACATYFEQRNAFNRKQRFIYIFGGINSSGLVNTIERYDLDANTITTVGYPIAQPKAGLSCITVRDAIYLVGGYKEMASKTALDSVEAFYPKANSFNTQIMNLKNGGRIRPALTVYNDKIYAFGGISDSAYQNTGSSSSQVYSVLDNQWSMSDALTIRDNNNAPILSNSPYSAAIGNKIYLFANNHQLVYQGNGELSGVSTSNTIHVRE